MRAPALAILAAVAVAEAAAQAPDSTAAVRVVVADSVRTDTVTARRARFAFPTEGGVFYYRAGAARRAPAPRAASGPALAAARPEAAAVVVRDTVVVRDGGPVRDRVVARDPAERRAEAASGVSPRDLDRLEDRILDRLERRLADRDRSRPRPATSAPETGVAPAPVRAGRPQTDRPELDPVRRYEPVPVPPVRPDGVTVDEIERDILDTGLFRTTAVHFEFARADLLPVSRRTLDALADVLRRYPGLRIEVGGHTDSVGSDATNDDLSARRAGSVAGYLAASGVDRARLSAAGYGERRPIASNETETGRALNRRVDFVVLDAGAAQTPR